MIWTITGPSASGKTTIARFIEEHVPGVRPLESVTTREKRPSDNPGEYEYVSDAEFDRLSRMREFLWEVSPHGHRYATRKSAVDAALESANPAVAILVIEAAVKLHAYAEAHGAKERVRSLFICINDEEELRRRLTERGDDPTDAQKRISECRNWNARAAATDVPFYFLAGEGSREGRLAEALAFFKR